MRGAIPPQVAYVALPAAYPMKPNVLAYQGIDPEKQKQKEQYENVLEDRDKSDQTSALSPQKAMVIRWNVPSLYQQNAHRLLKKITDHSDILTRNETEEAVVYGDTILGSNFKSLFKSMVSNQQNLNQVGINEFHLA